MDNHAVECMTEETAQLCERTIHTAHSVSFIEEKSKQISSQEENGRITIPSCASDNSENSGELSACIDIMLPPLESCVQNEHEHVKEIQCQNEEDENHQNVAENHSNKYENHIKVAELDNQVNNVVSQEETHNQMENLQVEAQEMEVHQDEVNVENIETLSFEDAANIGTESINNDKEGLNSHIDEEDEEENAAHQQDEISLNDYVLEEDIHDNSNPEEYDSNMHQEVVSEYISEDYVPNKEEEEEEQYEEEESLEQPNNNTSTEVNHVYNDLTSTTVIHLQNESAEEVITEEHDLHESSITAPTHDTYETYSSLRDSHESTAIENKEKDLNQLVVTTYRQKNIINIAAASANINIHDDVTETCEIITQVDDEEKQIMDNEVESLLLEESVDVSDGDADGTDNFVDNQEKEMLVIHKPEETTSEVIEEIYFIHDVGSCSSNNHEENKEVSSISEKINEDENLQEYEVDYSNSDKNSSLKKNRISEKSRNVIQDIFDDWGDENADEDNQIGSHKLEDTVEIELNNLLNDNNKKKKPLPSKEIQQNENKTMEDENPMKGGEEETHLCIVESMSSSTSSGSKPVKRISKSCNLKDDVPSYVQPYVRGTYSSSSSSSSSLNVSAVHQDKDEGASESNLKKKMQSPRLGVKVPSRHLKSQIATPAEVTEVLKERLREKQKDLESPQAADIVFVKKLTQRFASKICAGGTMPVPGLIPLSQQSRGNTSDNLERISTLANIKDNSTNSDCNPDNRELLAILEGDVDPDWSNLKSQTLTTTADDNLSGDGEYLSNSNVSSKLNPAEERELALKQLLEMPSSGNKRLKKKGLKADLNKHETIEKSSLSVRESKRGAGGGEVEKNKLSTVNKKLVAGKEKIDSSNSLKLSSSSSTTTTTRKSLKENDSRSTPSTTTIISETENRRIDETRSGRKRKPTEKALEQYASKRQKIYKTKSPIKIGVDTIETKESKSSNKMISDNQNESSAFVALTSVSTSKEIINKHATDECISKSSSSQLETSSKYDKNLQVKKSKGLVKKEENDLLLSSPLSLETRKKSTINASKKLISPKALTPKRKSTPTNLQNKIHTPVLPIQKRPVGRPAKSTVLKSSLITALREESTSLKKMENVQPKKKRKTGIKEIDKLLQDEGVVNLLYDVGQPRKRRLIPITKSQKKVMDIDKAERDLDLRKKLVKSTVLGLRESDIKGDKIAYRTKRRTTSLEHSNIKAAADNSVVVEKRKNSIEMSNEFIYPAKIRNAADASVIVRRHSSSSFSSVSGSPRVSIDSPLEGGNGGAQSNDEITNHGLRSTAKRKQSSMPAVDKDIKNNVSEVKRNKQHKNPKNLENVQSTGKSTTVIVTDIFKDDDNVLSSEKKQNKTETVEQSYRKSEKLSTSSSDTKESQGNNVSGIGKVNTRSNGSACLQTLSPKNQKKKGSAIKDKCNNPSNNKNADATVEVSTTSQDELSACLAEAATALSSVNNSTKNNNININSNNNNDNSSSKINGSSCITRRTSAEGTIIVGRKNKGITNSAKKQVNDTITNSSDNKSSSSKGSQNQTLEISLSNDNKEINVCRHGNLVQLILTSSSAKITLEVMQELCDTLKILKADQECRVVLFTSIGGMSFCEGLDLSTLLHTDEEKRKIYAEKVANAVKEFIKCLATFNKPLVAGVHGAAVGLGVTILPLFDLVIASDKATFYTPYGKLGQIPEGAAIMTLSHVHGSAVASELLLGGRTLTASEALRAGLVTRVLWPERFPLELLPSVKAMSEQSSQSMEATKALLRQSLRNKLNAALESETHILVKQWCSNECQEAIKTYLMKKND